MGSLSDIVINALYQLWHLLPIVIAIILFKKYIDNKDKKNRKSKNDENEKNGLTLKLRTIKKYEDLGYDVINFEEENNHNEHGLDLICNKEDKTLFIQCNNTFDPKSVTEEDIKTFYSNSIKYVKSNQLEKKNIDFRYVIAYKDVLDKSAVRILMDDFYNCKYVVV
jgi:hypothetical protein